MTRQLAESSVTQQFRPGQEVEVLRELPPHTRRVWRKAKVVCFRDWTRGWWEVQLPDGALFVVSAEDIRDSHEHVVKLGED